MAYALFKDGHQITSAYAAADDIPVQTSFWGGGRTLLWPTTMRDIFETDPDGYQVRQVYDQCAGS